MTNDLKSDPLIDNCWYLFNDIFMRTLLFAIVKKILLLLISTYLFVGCSIKPAMPPQGVNLEEQKIEQGFKGRTIASDELVASRQLVFTSGNIDPLTYSAPDQLNKDFNEASFHRAQSKGIQNKKDCLDGETNNYSYCLIVNADIKLKKLKQNDPFKALTAEEYANIEAFTNFAYQSINPALWSKIPKNMDKYEKEIKLMLSGLNRLPKVNQKVVRCDLVEHPDTDLEKISSTADRFAINKKLVIEGFWSTSLGKNREYIESWIEPCHVQLNIQLNGGGALISQLSSRPYEEEVLVRPKTVFNVIQKRKSEKNGKPFYEIDLVEVSK